MKALSSTSEFAKGANALCTFAAGPMLALLLVLDAGLAAYPAAADPQTAHTTMATARASRAGPIGPVEFWTIEPNEGQSAGGHAALRIGDVIHHLENRGDGLIRDRRDDRNVFEAAYRGRSNRSIHVLRLDVSAEVAEALDRSLRERHARRSFAIDRLEAIDEDLRWLDHTIDAGIASVAVPGLGLFEVRGRCRPGEALRLRSMPAFADALANGHRVLRARLAAATHPKAEGGGSLRGLVEAAQLVGALESIDRCRVLASDQLSEVDPDTTFPSGTDVGRLAPFALRLEQDLERLVASRRADRGLAILLAHARWQAIRRSERSGRLAVLDGFSEVPDGAHRTARASEMGSAWRDRRRADSNRRLARHAAAFLDADPSAPDLERVFDRLERAAHDARHADRGERHREASPLGALAITRTLERPSRRIALVWPAGATIDQLEARRDRLRRLRRERFGLLEEDLAYALFERNCVTELLASLDRALERDGATDSFAARRRRDLEAWLDFLPVSAHRIVARNARSEPGPLLASARRHAVSRALSEDRAPARLTVRIRESNTLSARTYRPHAEDSVFLFFTDRRVWNRPLLGITNLGFGLGAATTGILTAPFDRGKLLARGLRGAMMSVPELVFFNVRKGSYPVGPSLDWLREMDARHTAQSTTNRSANEKGPAD